jgi:hypothetical protein
MTYGYIEDLKFAVQVFDEGGNVLEVLGRLAEVSGQADLLVPGRTDFATNRSR